MPPMLPAFIVVTPPPGARSPCFSSAKDELRRPLPSWLSRSSSASLPASSPPGTPPLLQPARRHSLAAYAQRVWLQRTGQLRARDAIAHVSPPAAQAALRRVAVGGFALQQLLVCAVVGAATLYAPARAALAAAASPWVLGAAAAAQLGVVLALWLSDAVWPLLALFSLLHALLVAGAGARLDSALPLLNCLCACWGLCALTALLSTRAACAALNAERDGFLRWQLAAAAAFAWVAAPAALLSARSSVLGASWAALGASLALQLLLMGWFAWHASAVVLRALRPGEAVYGALHMNVDAPAAFLAGAVTAAAALLERCGGGPPDDSSEDEAPESGMEP